MHADDVLIAKSAVGNDGEYGVVVRRRCARFKRAALQFGGAADIYTQHRV